MTAETIKTDILVAGAGASGLIAALALARAGRKVVLAGKTPPPLAGRTVALFEGSLRVLDDLGFLPLVEANSAPITGFKIIDDSGSPFAPPPALMYASEIGLDAFGRNVANDALVRELGSVIAARSDIARLDAMVTDYEFRPDGVTAVLDDGRSLACALVIAADGRASKARAAARIAVREWSYPQTALTVFLRHRRPHHSISTEFQTRSGPFTFVPMQAADGGWHRSSLVWLMTPRDADRRRALDHSALALEIEDGSRHWFGAVRIEGETAFFPMRAIKAERVSAPRLMLVGEAAHVFPPLAAQGLNLGIRDVADAAQALDDADLGDGHSVDAACEAYESLRHADIDFRTRGVDLLNKSLLTRLPPVDFLRGVGLGLVANVGPLRRAILSEGIMPSLAKTLSRPRRAL